MLGSVHSQDRGKERGRLNRRLLQGDRVVWPHDRGVGNAARYPSPTQEPVRTRLSFSVAVLTCGLCRWFFGEITAEMAEAAIRNSGQDKKKGVFLVRYRFLDPIR